MSRDAFSEPWKVPEFDPTQFDPTLSLVNVVIEEIAESASVPRLPIGPDGVMVAQIDRALTNPELAVEARSRVEAAYNNR